MSISSLDWNILKVLERELVNLDKTANLEVCLWLAARIEEIRRYGT